MAHFFIVVLGSGLGGGCRYLISLLLFNYINYGVRFYLSTFTVNSIGSLLIGLVFALGTRGLVGDKGALLLTTGFMGGFTTFSSFSLENLRLLQQGEIATSILYIVSSIFFGLLFACIGYWLGKIV